MPRSNSGPMFVPFRLWEKRIKICWLLHWIIANVCAFSVAIMISMLHLVWVCSLIFWWTTEKLNGPIWRVFDGALPVWRLNFLALLHLIRDIFFPRWIEWEQSADMGGNKEEEVTFARKWHGDNGLGHHPSGAFFKQLFSLRCYLIHVNLAKSRRIWLNLSPTSTRDALISQQIWST